MTKTAYRLKMRELINRTAINMKALSEKTLNSGAIDLENAKDDYLLPKAVMHAICQEMAYQWEVLSKDSKEMSDNILLFL